MKGTAVPFVAWIRRAGAAWAHDRPRKGWPWEKVAVTPTEAEAWLAAERERAGRPWTFACWCVLRKGERPETALRRSKIVTTRAG
jgi:hypothetical protein